MKDAAVVTDEASVTMRNLSTVLVLKLLQYPILALYVVLVPRLMGPDTYGKFALLFSILAISFSLTELGITEVFGRFVPEVESASGRPGLRRLFSSVLALKVAVDLALAVVLFPVLRTAYGDVFPTGQVLLILLIVVIVDLGSVPHAFLFGLNQMGRYAVEEPLRRALSLVLTVALFIALGFPGAVLALLVVSIALAALYFGWTRSYVEAESFRIDTTYLKPYLKFGLVFYLSWALLAVWQRAGNALIQSATGSPREVAMFDMANQMFLLTVMFTLYLISSLIPMFTKLVLAGKQWKLKVWSGLLLKYTVILCTLVFGVFVLAGRELVALVIGPEFAAVYPNGVVLLAGVFPVILAQLGFVFSVVHKRPVSYSVSLAAALVTFLAAAGPLIAELGALGCAVATLVSCFVFAGVMFAAFSGDLAPSVPGALKCMAAAVPFALLVLLKQDLATNSLLALAFVVGYPLALFGARALSRAEIGEILRALRHRPGRPAEA